MVFRGRIRKYMKKKVILFDIDGTLIDCSHGHTSLNDITKQALLSLKEQGHYLFIASGRPYCYIMDELLSFPFDGYILNDGSYVLFQDQELLYQPILEKDIQPIIDQVKEKRLTFIGYGKQYAYVLYDDGSLVDYAKTFMINDQLVKMVQDISEIPEPFLKIHIQCNNEKDYQYFKLDNHQFYCADDNSHYLKEIYSKRYTKATALKSVLKQLKVSIEDTYFFGDGFNDIEMMDTVAHSIAMDNASDEVKQHANYICKSVAQDGVADFILHSDLFNEEES